MLGHSLDATHPAHPQNPMMNAILCLRDQSMQRLNYVQIARSSIAVVHARAVMLLDHAYREAGRRQGQAHESGGEVLARMYGFLWPADCCRCTAPPRLPLGVDDRPYPCCDEWASCN